MGVVAYKDKFYAGSVDDKMAWTLLDTKTGTADISLPSNYNELFIKVKFGSYDIYVPMFIPRIVLTSSYVQYRAGYYSLSTAHGMVSIAIKDTMMNIYEVYLNGSNITSTSEIKVYYR